MSGENILEPDKELAIHITVDAKNKSFVIEDTGIGVHVMKKYRFLSFFVYIYICMYMHIGTEIE